MTELIENLDIEEYHQRPEWSRSQVMDYIRSPELFCAKYIDCTIPRSIEPTAAMEFGSMVDAYLTERIGPSTMPPEAWAIATEDDVSKSGSKVGSAWKAFEAAHPGKICKSPKEWAKHVEKQEANREILLAIDQQVANHEMARRYLRDPTAIFQPSFICADDNCRARPDFVVPGVAIVDIKCMARVDQRSVVYSVIDYGYDIQAAMSQVACAQYYRDGELLPFVLLCVHSSAPYEIVTYELDQRFVDAGWERFCAALDMIEEKQWVPPGHGQNRGLAKPDWFRVDSVGASLPVEQQIY